MKAYNPKIVHLPGSKLTPEVVLHRTLQKIDRIKSVCMVIQWDDDTFDIDWSQQKTSELCMASITLQDEALRAIKGES